MKKILILFLGIKVPIIAFSQNNQAKGRVLDELTSNPISGATIKVGNNTFLSDENGNFNFDCNKGITISANADDYKSNSIIIKDCEDVLLVTLRSTKIQNLSEIEITATSNPHKEMLYQPSSIARLGLNEIKRGNGLFMDDAINTNIAGVAMQRRTVSAGQTINIRGYGNGIRGANGLSSNFDTQGSKIYLNGILITDAEGITLMDDIDFGSIAGVEVLKGPAGSLYGLAIAGAVNLKTVRPQAGKISIGQDVMFGSYGLQRYTTTLQIGTARSSLLVNYGKQKFDGFMPHTASTKDFVTIVGTYDANEKQSMNVYFGHGNSYDERNGELTASQYDTLNYSGNPAYIKNNAHSNVISARAGFGHTYKFSKNFSNTTTVFASGISSNASSAGGWTDKLPVNYGLRSTFDYSRKLSDKITISGVTGIEAQRQNAQTIGYNMVVDSLNPLGDNLIGSMRSNTYAISKTYSYFTEWTLALPYETSLTAGVGVSNMSIELNDRFYVASNNSSNPNVLHKPTQYKNSFNNLVSPHVALNKVINKKISVYASYGVGYKAPVSSYFYIPLTGELNTNLKPEFGTQYEIGTKGLLFKNKLSYQIALFNTIYKDKMTIVAVPNAVNTATSYTYVANGGTQNNKGLELSIKYTVINSESGFIRNLSPFANLTYSNFKFEEFRFEQLNSTKDEAIINDLTGKYVAGVPPIVYNAGVDFSSNLGIYANMTYSYRGEAYYTAFNDNTKVSKSFGLLNAKVGYTRTFFNHFNLDAFFGANNITSIQYYQMLFANQTPDVYLPGPCEINFFGGLNLKYYF